MAVLQGSLELYRESSGTADGSGSEVVPAILKKLAHTHREAGRAIEAALCVGETLCLAKSKREQAACLLPTSPRLNVAEADKWKRTRVWMD